MEERLIIVSHTENFAFALSASKIDSEAYSTCLHLRHCTPSVSLWKSSCAQTKICRIMKIFGPLSTHILNERVKIPDATIQL